MDDKPVSQPTHDRCDCGGTLQLDDTKGIAHCPDCGSHERYIPVDGRKIIAGLEEAVAHARGEVSLLVKVRLPNGERIEVDTRRDHESGVWTATSRDVPELVIQGETWSTLMTKLTLAIPSRIGDVHGR